MTGEEDQKQRALILPRCRVLATGFFDRDAATVARDLIGKILVRECGGANVRVAITETEAYLGAHDLASHSARGRTARTEVMFGPPGIFYVYLVYGLHWMLNVVTGPANHPSAVLIRGAGAYKGPGQLTRGLNITRDLNGLEAMPTSGLGFEDEITNTPLVIKAGPRVGVDYAGPVWSQRKLRFLL